MKGLVHADFMVQNLGEYDTCLTFFRIPGFGNKFCLQLITLIKYVGFTNPGVRLTLPVFSNFVFDTKRDRDLQAPVVFNEFLTQLKAQGFGFICKKLRKKAVKENLLADIEKTIFCILEDNR